MIEQELILLGLLKDSPKHGYQIKKQIKEIFSLFAGVDLASIYYPLKVLEKKGMVVKESCKSGKRPRRDVYMLTPKGHARFNYLLEKSFLNFKRPQFTLDLSLFFLQYIEPRLARRRLHARSLILARIAKGLTQLPPEVQGWNNFSLQRVIQHNLDMLKTESAFLNNLTRTLKSDS